MGSKRNISGEETDYLLKLKKLHNYKIFFDPEINIFHDDFKRKLENNKNISKELLCKSYNYGFGSSLVLIKNNLKILNVLILFKIFINLILSLLKFEYIRTRIIFYNLLGRLRGILL